MSKGNRNLLARLARLNKPVAVAVFISTMLFSSACATSASRMLSGEAGSGALPPVVFLSDFGVLDESVSVCKGRMLRVEPALTIVDLTHQVPAFSVRDAARLMAITAPHYADETVFLALVDQHVEGPKRAIVVKSKRGQYFLAPDNGLLSLVMENEGVAEVRQITVGQLL